MPRKNNTGVAGALRLAQTQPVTFSEGLIRTDDNSILGYVSDLYNAEIDRNGNIRRRKGSVVMNSGKLNEKWYFKESYQIAGVTVLFGLSYKRELWAWIGAWPETDFKVCEKNIYSRFPHYSSGSNKPDYNPWVSFSRGSSFHVLKTDRHMTIVNNLNDAIRIYNRGCFAIAKYNEDVTKIFMKDDIDASRNETDIDLALYVSVKDVTNRIMEPAIVVKSDDRYPLVEGTVQFAAMNEENVPGKFTDPEKIETGSPYFSIFESVWAGENGLIVPKNRFLYASNGVQNENFVVSKNNYGDSYSVHRNTWTPDIIVDETSWIKDTYEVAIIMVRDYSTNNKYDFRMYFLSNNGGADIPALKNEHGQFFKLYNVRTFHSERSDFNTTPRPRNLGNMVVSTNIISETIPESSVIRNNAIDMAQTHTLMYNLAHNKYVLTFPSTPANKCRFYALDEKYMDQLKSTEPSYYDFVYSDKTESYPNKLALFFANIELYLPDSETDLKYDVNEVAIKYESFVFSEDCYVFEHSAFNVWDLLSKYYPISESTIDIKSDFSLVSQTYSSELMLVNNKDGQCGNFMVNGFKWCVKSGDNIVVESQKAHLNLGGNIVYSLEKTEDDNYNKLPSEIIPAYLPVASLHGSRILRYPDPDKNTDVFYDVQYAFNVDDVLIVIQDGAIWTGNTNTLKLTYDKAIQGAVLSADRFYNGVLIGTTDGIYFYNNGKLEHCVDGQKITAITIASGTNGAVVVDDNGRLYYAYIMLMESGFYAKVTDIHRNVSDIDFGSAIVKYVNGVFYFAMEDQVIGLYIERGEDGTVRRFDRIFNFEGQKIDGITEYEGQPVLWFGTGAVKSEVFEQPYDGGIK